MIKTAILSCAALIGLAVPTDAQIQLHGRIGKHFRVSATFGNSHYPQHHVVRSRSYRQRTLHRGHHDRVFVPARYGWVYDSCGYRVWGIIAPARYDRVHHTGRSVSRHRGLYR